MSRRLRHIAIAAAVGAAVALGLLLPGAPPTYAFEKDGHYYLKFMLALRVSCYSWQEAHLIASGDWAQDLNDTTVAHVKIATAGSAEETIRKKWHAFGTDADFNAHLAANDARWKAENNQTKRLVKFGQLFHFTEDRFSHRGYGVAFGHGKDTATDGDPDSFKKDATKTKDMVRDTLTRMRAACSEFGAAPASCNTVNRVPANTVDDIMNEAAFKAMLDKIIADSDANWYAGGNRALKMDPIIAQNKATMEAYIKDHIGAAALTAKCAPNPANPVLPEPVTIKYDEAGEPKKVGDQEFTFVDPKTHRSELRYVSIDVVPVSPTLVNLEMELTNAGDMDTLPGVMIVTSRDFVTETFVADNIEALSPISPGGSSLLTVPLAISPAFAGHLLTVDAEVDDADAGDNGRTIPFGAFTIGGIAERVASGGDAPAASGGGSGTSATTYGVLAGGIAAAALAVACGWYVRRRIR